MKKDRIAAQLYTVRDYCNDAHDLVEALGKVRALGFRAVEMSSLGPLPPKDLAKALDAEGLTCCGTHEDGEELLTDPAAIVERLAVLGCTNVTYPYPEGQDFSSIEAVKRLAKALNRTGKTLRKEGITFSYHNHNMELHRLNGKTVLEWLKSESDPDCLSFELDSYWLQAGGADPADWIAGFKGRCTLVHLKDYGVDPKGRATFEEIGQGNLDWKAVVPAAKRAGAKWYVIEQDSDWEGGDPFQSLKISLAYLKKGFVEAG
jgi:sugar phosphate isomerase/epimerase